MKNLTDKQRKFIIYTFVFLFIIGIFLGIFVGLSRKNKEDAIKKNEIGSKEVAEN